MDTITELENQRVQQLMIWNGRIDQQTWKRDQFIKQSSTKKNMKKSEDILRPYGTK